MAFVYEKGKHAAVNPETGVTIGMGMEFYDSTTYLPASYKDNELQFNFPFHTISEKFKIKPKNGEMKRPRIIALYVGLPDLKTKLSEALSRVKRPPLTNDEFERLMENIKDGLFVWWTGGGRILEEVPDFKVDFFQSVNDLPPGIREQFG